jgi:DNA-binding transcriptional LysR family regulator
MRELESYHSMLACVSAGGGLAIMPRSMLESMPGSQTVRAWPMGKEFGLLKTWLVWRKDTISKSLAAFTQLVKTPHSA